MTIRWNVTLGSSCVHAMKKRIEDKIHSTIVLSSVAQWLGDHCTLFEIQQTYIFIQNIS